jgi:hypothetical protein
MLMPAITISWRDENYGAWEGAQQAFRLFLISAGDRPCGRRMEEIIRASGFDYCPARGSWISYLPDSHQVLSAALAGEGIEIMHAGRHNAAVFAPS